MIRTMITGLACLALTGCGAVYSSSSVPRDAPGVRVLSLTADSVLTANSTPYVPRALPAVFEANAGAGSDLGAPGAVPPAALSRPVRPGPLALDAPPAVRSGSYAIGIGDVLLLATRSDGSTAAELSGLLAAANRRQGYTVRSDGAIAIPDIGRVPVAGLTLEGAEDALFQALVANNIDPTFSLEVAEFNSGRVSVGGAVANPTVVPVALTELTLDAALAGAGGVSTGNLDFALIRIYRDGRLYRIPIADYLSRPALQKTVLIAGDSVFVGEEFDLDRAQAYFSEQIQRAGLQAAQRSQALAELTTEVGLRRAALDETRGNFQDRFALDAVERDYVYLTGEVRMPSRFPLPFGRQATLADALFESGGFESKTANPGQIYVLRAAADSAEPGAVIAWHLDARNAVMFTVATRMQMRPGDVIFVAEQLITRWNRSISQLVPQVIAAGNAAN
ncbi:MAG: polysaccharide biosynthesis/export family protein [Jannaschia helgolandensis]|jgi:polysaccharide biosynthesis/export protein|uniref:Polysaccharide export outer membrane protein n=1 Tax=Jannaschia helgolandensis TaxID=188906 RepID=A0A1H7GPY7_9RHOB|nr:polysaccharide biosynthesis/export family protein [Jannaschia helgolandensis]SEK38650.1 polysaccharide export outer membrane protein [Jannaschia helgolandensis]